MLFSVTCLPPFFNLNENISTVASIITTMSALYMTKTQNLLHFSFTCHPIHPVIHKDPLQALRFRAAYDTLMVAWVVSGIVS